MAGPLTAVGGFHRKPPVFSPSPEVKLLGKGKGVRIEATAESTGRPAVLFAADRLS